MFDSNFIEATDFQSSLLERRQVVVSSELDGERLDKTLASAVPEFSRSYWQGLISEGFVGLYGAAHGPQTLTKASKRMNEGDVLDVHIQLSDSALAYTPEDMALDILFEDAHVLVINKPAGLVVHPAAGHWSGTLLNGLLHHFERDGYQEALGLPRAGIIHRLDKDTSGAMVVCKTHVAQTKLVQDLGERLVSRQYLTICPALVNLAGKGKSQRTLNHGAAFPHTITNRASIGRDTHSRTKMSAFDPHRLRAGDDEVAIKAAQTDFLKLVSNDTLCLVACKLHSGRTHQIRVHLADLGFPVVGDQVYGGSMQLGMMRQALHARRLCFTHPVTQAQMVFVAPLPTDFERLALQIAPKRTLDTLIDHRNEFFTS